MHWGVRRYQNEDGTLTSAGRKHYKTGKKIKLYANRKGRQVSDFSKAKYKQASGFVKRKTSPIKSKYNEIKGKNNVTKTVADHTEFIIGRNKEKISKRASGVRFVGKHATKRAIKLVKRSPAKKVVGAATSVGKHLTKRVIKLISRSPAAKIARKGVKTYNKAHVKYNKKHGK